MKTPILKSTQNGFLLANLFTRSLIITVFLLLAAGCAGQVQNPAPQQEVLNPDVASVQSQIDEFSREHGNIGVVVLLGKQGVNQEYASGMADASIQRSAKTNDLFQIGSASKMFTAVAIQQLIENGKLSLETPVSRFFNSPEYRKLGNFKGENYWDKITVEMLLNHTSGMIDYLNIIMPVHCRYIADDFT